MTATRKKPIEEVDFGEAFLDEDVTKLSSMVKKATVNREVISREMRMKKKWLAADGRRAQAFAQTASSLSSARMDSIRAALGRFTKYLNLTMLNCFNPHDLKT